MIPTARLTSLEPRRLATTDQLEALAYATTMRGVACHLDMGDPTRDVLRAGGRVVAWVAKAVSA